MVCYSAHCEQSLKGIARGDAGWGFLMELPGVAPW